jgi:hypothetical protein
VPYNIHVRGSSPKTDNAAVQTAFNNLLTALRALAGGKAVDVGGSVIDGVPQTGDEIDLTKTKLPFGATF